jgi:hypothetical protein
MSVKERQELAKGIYAEVLVAKTIRKSRDRSFVDVRFTTKEEDANGIDLIIRFYSRGIRGRIIEMPLQIKSSQRGARSHKLKNTGKSYIPVIIVKRGMSRWSIYQEVLRAKKYFKINTLSSR